MLNNAFDDSSCSLFGWDTLHIGWASASWWMSYLSAWASPARRFTEFSPHRRGTAARAVPRPVRGDLGPSPRPSTRPPTATASFQLNMVNPSRPGLPVPHRRRHLRRRPATTCSISLSSTGGPGRASPGAGAVHPQLPAGHRRLFLHPVRGHRPQRLPHPAQHRRARFAARHPASPSPRRTPRRPSIGLSSALTIASHTTLSIDTVAAFITTKADSADLGHQRRPVPRSPGPVAAAPARHQPPGRHRGRARQGLQPGRLHLLLGGGGCDDERALLPSRPLMSGYRF